MLPFNLKYFSAHLLQGFTIYNLRYFMLKKKKTKIFIEVNGVFEFKNGIEK